MEKKKPDAARLILRIDMVLLLPCLAVAFWYVREIHDYMSFGGFEALFMLLFREPYLWALGGALALALLADWLDRALLAGVSAGLQILAPIPWLLLVTYGFEGHYSWVEALMALDLLAGVVVLFSLLHWKRKQ